MATRGDRHVLLDRASLDDAVELAVLRAEHDAGADGMRRAVGRDGDAVDRYRAAGASIGAIDEAGHFAAAGADKAEEAEDLAASDGEA
ncbi:hypothetical protein D3C78_1650370 [compost metagenome]